MWVLQAANKNQPKAVVGPPWFAYWTRETPCSIALPSHFERDYMDKTMNGVFSFISAPFFSFLFFSHLAFLAYFFVYFSRSINNLGRGVDTLHVYPVMQDMIFIAWCIFVLRIKDSNYGCHNRISTKRDTDRFLSLPWNLCSFAVYVFVFAENTFIHTKIR